MFLACSRATSRNRHTRIRTRIPSILFTAYPNPPFL
nr:MAG TPA: hypothetical protein [Caudoviricetes sp.]